MFRTGLVSVSFRDKTPLEIIKAAAGTGLSCIEWGSDVHAPFSDTQKLAEIKKECSENGIACVRGNGCRVKGGIGAILVIAEENEYDRDIKEWKAFVVDGKKIKADTYYTLRDGEIVEADNE